MYCPFCGHEETKVNDSRLAGEGRQIRRRRECLECAERFTTFDQVGRLGSVAAHVDREARVDGRQGLLPFGVAPVGAVGLDGSKSSRVASR